MLFKIETVSEIVDDIIPLNKAHYEEVFPGARFPLKIDYNKYVKLNELGLFKIFGLRDDGKLVGYNGFWVTDRIHCNDEKMAVNDIFFIEPSYRGKITGEFIDYCETELKALGVHRICYNAPIGTKLGAVVSKKNYSLWEQVFTKEV